MDGINEVKLLGNVANELKLRKAGSASVATVCVAVNKTQYNKETREKKESCDFVNVQVWNKLAETCCAYLKKGSLVFVEASVRPYKRDGAKFAEMDIVANKVLFLNKVGLVQHEAPAAEASNEEQQPAATPAADPALNDDLPF